MPLSWGQSMLRRKAIDMTPTKLVKKLTSLDLIALGVGATLGAGVYVLTGTIGQTTGPATIICFMISGFASILSGICYAEFGARVPRAGSAYVYSFVTVGEAIAWTTGWQLLLEYIIGASTVARAWSGYLDSLSGGAISSYMASHIPAMHVPGLATEVDFLAFSVTMLLTCVCAFGAKESSLVNNFLTGTNVLVIGFTIIAGSFYAKPENYTPFAPHPGLIFGGAATSFFAYVGFDVIATSAEEALNPSFSVPVGIIGSLLICACCYMGVAGIITLMVPYASISVTAPLPAAFAANGAQWASYVVDVGAVCGLTTSLMTCIFPMPRIVYAIASDGLLPRWLGDVSPRFGTPVAATLLCGLFAATMALMFDVQTLASMMSIGTLIAYTLVCISVLILRYREWDERTPATVRTRAPSADAPLLSPDGCIDERGIIGIPGVMQLSADRAVVLMWGRRVTTYRAAVQCLLVFVVGMSLACAMGVIHFDFPVEAVAERSALIAVVIVGLIVAVIGAAGIILLPSARPLNVSFISPLFPFLPLIAISINLYLLASLDKWTWLRFAVWCALGTAIYLGYGIHHSNAAVTSAKAATVAVADDDEVAASGSINADDSEQAGEDSGLLR